MIKIRDEIEAVFAVEDAKELADKLNRNMRDFYRELTYFQSDLNLFDEDLALDLLSLEDANDALAGIEQRLATLKSTVLKAYYLLTVPLTYGGLLDLPSAEKDHFFSIDKPIEGVDSYYENGLFFVRTPMLASRNYYSAAVSKGAKTNSYLRDCAPIFKDTVRQSMANLMREINDDLSAFRSKTILFLFSYSSANRRKMLDNDNHDTKGIQDAITSHLPGGDGALSCRVIYDTVLTDEVEEGTYITVMPSNRTVSNEEVVKFWGRITSKK